MSLKKHFLASVFILIFGLVVSGFAFFPSYTFASNPSAFHISQLQNGVFEEKYASVFPVQYTTKNFNFNNLNNSLTLQINESGDLPYSGIDAIILNACGTKITPSSAFYSDTNESVLEDILNIDLNVVISHNKPIQISWNLPQGCSSATLSLNANEYGKGTPFRFPISGTAEYNMGSNSGSLVVDGLINETDGSTPLYTSYWTPASGHPNGNVYFYAKDDAEYLYFAADITIDNTDDAGPDWISIIIGNQKFLVNDADNTYGKCGFGLTSKVSYKHQTCELKIPKSMIGNNNIPFVLGYYGTATPNLIEISLAEITGVTPPVIGATPVTTITSTIQYTGAITWLPADATFASGTSYTATIILSPNTLPTSPPTQYEFAGVDANFFTVAGATTTNDADSGVVTAVFGATAAPDINPSSHSLIIGTSKEIMDLFRAEQEAKAKAVQQPNTLITSSCLQGQSFNTTTGAPCTAFITSISLRTLKLNMIGEDVKTLQTYLNTAKFDCGIVDGKFGPKTKASVILFQKANGLVPDGIVGPLTMAKMK